MSGMFIVIVYKFCIRSAVLFVFLFLQDNQLVSMAARFQKVGCLVHLVGVRHVWNMSGHCVIHKKHYLGDADVQSPCFAISFKIVILPVSLW